MDEARAMSAIVAAAPLPPGDAPAPVLRTEGLSKRFGAFAAVSDVSLSFAPGVRHALIGPNGAGKTTFINLLTGFVTPSAGNVFLGERLITGLAQHQRVKCGMARAGVWYTTVSRQAEAIDEAIALLESLRLVSERNELSRNLAYGKQRLLEIALALATRPSILLLDEPAAGIPSAESAELFGVIARLPRDVTIVFIEHDMELVFRFAERITVLVGGRVLTEAAPAEIARDPQVKEVYLGEAQHA
jgi:branched-chain amino acid transport system ATP-binding protein